MISDVLNKLLQSRRARKDLLSSGVTSKTPRDPSVIAIDMQVAEDGIAASVKRRQDRVPQYREAAALGDLGQMEALEKADDADVLEEKRLRAIVPALVAEFEEATKIIALERAERRRVELTAALTELRGLLTQSPTLIENVLENCDAVSKRLAVINEINGEFAGQALQHMEQEIPADIVRGIQNHQRYAGHLRQILGSWRLAT